MKCFGNIIFLLSVVSLLISCATLTPAGERVRVINEKPEKLGKKCKNLGVVFGTAYSIDSMEDVVITLRNKAAEKGGTDLFVDIDKALEMRNMRNMRNNNNNININVNNQTNRANKNIDPHTFVREHQDRIETVAIPISGTVYKCR